MTEANKALGHPEACIFCLFPLEHLLQMPLGSPPLRTQSPAVRSPRHMVGGGRCGGAPGYVPAEPSLLLISAQVLYLRVKDFNVQ